MAIDLTTVHFTGATFSLLFAVIFLSLHRLEGREPSLPLWAASHAAYAARHAMHFFATPEFYGPWFVPGLSLLFVGFAMAGALALAGRRIPLAWLVAASLAEVLWILFADWAALSLHIRLVPIAAAVGVAMMVAGLAFAVLAWRERSFACAIAAAAHVVWSITSFGVMLRSPVAAHFGIGVIMATLGSMAIAILVIVTVLRRRRAASDRAAHDLMAAQARLESLIGTASDWVWEIDARYRYTYLSARFGEITGADAHRLIGARWDAPWSAHRSNERVWADFRAALQVGRSIRGFRHPAHMADGRPIVLLINADPIHDAAGRVIGFRGTGRDATTEIAVGAIMDVFAGDAANRIGIEYFRTLVGNLGVTLNADAVFAARIRRDAAVPCVRTLAAWADGAVVENSEYPLEGTLSDCLDSEDALIFLRDVRSLFVRDPSLASFQAEGYAGIGLGGEEARPLGVIAVISRHGFTDIATIETVLKVVAPRAAAELERQIADERLRESEARFRDVIDHMPVAIGARDHLGRFVFVNRTYQTFNGMQAPELIGRTMGDAGGRLGADELVARFAAADARVLAAGETLTEEIVRPDKPTADGPGVFLVTRFPIRDAAGEIVAVGSVSLDITARRAADDRLRESEARFRAVMEHMPLAFTARDLQGRHILANPAYEAIAGRTAEELIGRRLDELTGTATGAPTRFDEFDRRVVETNQAYAHEMDRTDARFGGQKSRFLVTRFPIRDAAGKTVAIGSVGTDINELKRIERELRESEARFRSVIEHMPLSFCVRDLEGRFLVTNPTYDAIGGIAARETVGRPMSDFVEAMGGDDIVRTAIGGDATVLSTGQVFTTEIVRPDHRRGGAPTNFLVTRFPIRGADDQIVAVGSVALDITEERKADQERRKSETLLRAIIDNLPVGFLLSVGGRVGIANPAFARISGLPIDGIVGRAATDMRDQLPDTRLWDTAVLGDLSALPMPHVSQHVGPDPTDPSRELAISLTRFRVAASGADLSSYGVIVQDITESWNLSREREARERAIQASEARFRAVVDNIPFGFSLRDREGRFLIVNRAYEVMLGLGAKQLLGRTPDDVIPLMKVPDTLLAWREGDRQVIDGGVPVSTETETPSVNHPGAMAATHIVRFPVFEGGNAATGVASIAIDITGRRRMQQAIVAREAELHRVLAALDMAREGIVVEEASGRVLYANRVARAIVEPSGSAVALLQRSGHRVPMADQGHWSGEVALPRGDARNAEIAVDCVVLADGTVVTVLDDVTDEKTQRRDTEILERRLRRAEKMEALGRLAGGIAHDFNNLLGAIVGFAGFIAEDSEPGGRVHAFAERILAASDRAKGIVREVLAFSRPPEPRRQRVALGGHLIETLEILRPAMPAGVTVEVATHDPEIAIDADPAQLTQVVMNLVLNAADALEGKPGTIRIAAELAEPPSPLVTDRLDAEPDIEVSALPDGRLRCTVGQMSPGSVAVIRVTDSGHGIARQTLERIFDPFFTTKTKGKGTGLGLPVVHGIVLAHHGAMVVHTRVGEGTTFEVMLPAAASSEVRALDVTARMGVSGRGRILVVDDDEDFGDMVAIALGRAGYETAVVNHPAAALDVVGDDPTVWDLVITDHTMPGMTGMQLIERLAVLQPDLPCVLCTGFGIGVDEASARAGGASAFLQKPIEITSLVEQVGRLIELSRAA